MIPKQGMGRAHLISPVTGSDRKLSDFPVKGWFSWSPDGRWLAVTATAPRKGRRRLRPGPPVSICCQWMAASRNPSASRRRPETSTAPRLPRTGAAWPIFSAHRREQHRRRRPGSRLHADGRVVFTSARSGDQEIWIAEADGSNPTQLTTAGALAGLAPLLAGRPAHRFRPPGRGRSLGCLDDRSKPMGARPTGRRRFAGSRHLARSRRGGSRGAHQAWRRYSRRGVDRPHDSLLHEELRAFGALRPAGGRRPRARAREVRVVFRRGHGGHLLQRVLGRVPRPPGSGDGPGAHPRKAGRPQWSSQLHRVARLESRSSTRGGSAGAPT